MPKLQWYFAFNLFRLAAIIQGLKRRVLDGNASSAEAEEPIAWLVPLARTGWQQAQLAAIV
jgi:aminoglycoside phosphotransferase (APT) family kinase protein